MLTNMLKKLIKKIVSLYCIFRLSGNMKISAYCDTNYLFYKIVSYLAKNNTDFFFIQIGAGDGILRDHIHDYVIKYHWSGILLEPVKYVFKRLTGNYKEENKLIFENMAMSDKSDFKDFYYLRETADTMPEWRDLLGSFLKENVLKNKTAIPDIEKYIVTEKIRTITFKDLILKYKVKKIDLLYIDTEGYDYEILKLIDFKDIKPKIIMYEHKHLSGLDYEESKKILRMEGYLVYKFSEDDTISCLKVSFWERLKIVFCNR